MKHAQGLLRIALIAILLSAAPLASAGLEVHRLSADAVTRAAAAFASYRDARQAHRAAARIAHQLDTPVRVRKVRVNEEIWYRVQSTPIDEAAARILIDAAMREGYTAWFLAPGGA